MKNCFSTLRRKTSYLLKWSPVSCVYSFSGTRLDLFSTYHEHILSKNLLYIYMINILLSLSIISLFLLYFWQRSSIQLGFYMFMIASISIFYHATVFILLKVNCLKKKVQKFVGVLNLLSLCIIHIFLGYYVLFLSSTSNNSFVVFDSGVIIAAFEGSVVMFYFQNSFVMSFILWLILAAVTCVGYLLNVNQFTDEVAPVVSIMHLCVCVCVCMHVCMCVCMNKL